MIRILDLHGSPADIGRQHGEQVAALRPLVLASIGRRRAEFQDGGVDTTPYVDEISALWRRYTPETLEMLRGIAAALELDWDGYLSYVISPYIAVRLSWPRQRTVWDDGCTTWAASTPIAVGPLVMAKNRDHHPEQRPLQCLARVAPARGQRYLCVTTAGAPGVASSGINEVGLAVADTYVASTDVGPGIGRYSLMATLLERCSTVDEAIRQMRSQPHFGNGTVIVGDAQGDKAVLEIAHTAQAVVRSDDGCIVSTNHFTAATTRRFSLCGDPRGSKADTVARRARVERQLHEARGSVDIAWAQALMAEHGETANAICRHVDADPDEITISTAVFEPRARMLHFADGRPCEVRFSSLAVA